MTVPQTYTRLTFMLRHLPAMPPPDTSKRRHRREVLRAVRYIVTGAANRILRGIKEPLRGHPTTIFRELGLLDLYEPHIRLAAMRTVAVLATLEERYWIRNGLSKPPLVSRTATTYRFHLFP